MKWFAPKCPVRAEEQEWIERSMHWLRAQFGTAALYRDVLLPVVELFPHPYDGTAANAQEILRMVCHQMGLDADDVDLEILSADTLTELPDGAGIAGPSLPEAAPACSTAGRTP